MTEKTRKGAKDIFNDIDSICRTEMGQSYNSERIKKIINEIDIRTQYHENTPIAKDGLKEMCTKIISIVRQIAGKQVAETVEKRFEEEVIEIEGRKNVDKNDIINVFLKYDKGMRSVCGACVRNLGLEDKKKLTPTEIRNFSTEVFKNLRSRLAVKGMSTQDVEETIDKINKKLEKLGK